MNNLSFLHAALEYAARGFHVFPLIGKRPATSNGFYDASTLPDIIKEWWQPSGTAYNIGIRTGLASGIWVLDVDWKPGGANGFRTLRNIAGDFEWARNVPFQITGSGGGHFFFACEDERLSGSVGKIGQALDVRANGGYIVAAPSVHPTSGRAYKWRGGRSILNLTTPPAPDWLSQAAFKQPECRPAIRTPATTFSPEYGRKALRGECQKIEKAPNGKQHQTLNNSAFKVGKLVAKGALDEFDAARELQQAALMMVNYDQRRPWSKSEIERVISNAISDGKSKA